jgi:hypothetical protein
MFGGGCCWLALRAFTAFTFPAQAVAQQPKDWGSGLAVHWDGLGKIGFCERLHSYSPSFLLVFMYIAFLSYIHQQKKSS